MLTFQVCVVARHGGIVVMTRLVMVKVTQLLYARIFMKMKFSWLPEGRSPFRPFLSSWFRGIWSHPLMRMSWRKLYNALGSQRKVAEDNLWFWCGFCLSSCNQRWQWTIPSKPPFMKYCPIQIPTFVQFGDSQKTDTWTCFAVLNPKELVAHSANRLVAHTHWYFTLLLIVKGTFPPQDKWCGLRNGKPSPELP